MRQQALVVEDNEVTQHLLRRLLEAEGFTVDAVGDGGEAIEFVSRNDYAIILLDIVLPTVSGTAVMEHLKQTKPAQLQRVIVVSGLDVAEIRALFPAVRQVLGKPVLPGRLRAVVRSCLETSEAVYLSQA